MKEWITNYMILLLSEHEDKLAEILGMLVFFQCVTFFCVSLLAVSLKYLENDIKETRKGFRIRNYE